MVMNKEILAATERELSEWPGVTMTQESQGKHGRVILHFGGQSRIVVVANTPSDHRALPNHIATMRRELRGLGAVKNAVVVGKPKAERPFKAPEPATQQPFKELEQVMSQPKKIATIFRAIEELRYSEMLEFAGMLAEAATETKLRRGFAHSWAQTLQFAIDVHGDRQENAHV